MDPFNKADDDDDDCNALITPPTRVIQCFNKDGTLNILKYMMYRRQKRQKQSLQQPIYLMNVDDDVNCTNFATGVDNYLEEVGYNNEDNNNNQRINQQIYSHSVYRKGINRMRNSDGSINLITPKMSLWYITYIVDPQVDCKKFIYKFRRRFRCSYSSFLLLLDLVRNHNDFSRWHNVSDAVGRECSPLELLLLGALRYLGRGWTFDDLEEATSISEEIHRVFFHIFIQWGRNFLYDKYIVTPTNSNELKQHTKEMEEAGLNGCIGSVDATHIGMLRCPASRWNQHKGPKEGFPARSYNLVVNHRRKIISSTTGHPSRWNDKTITLHDKFLCNVQRKQQFNDYRFDLNKKMRMVLLVKFSTIPFG
jgi:hypothetical protein